MVSEIISKSLSNTIIWSSIFFYLEAQQTIKVTQLTLPDKSLDGWTYYNLSKQEGQVTH